MPPSHITELTGLMLLAISSPGHHRHPGWDPGSAQLSKPWAVTLALEGSLTNHQGTYFYTLLSHCQWWGYLVKSMTTIPYPKCPFRTKIIRKFLASQISNIQIKETLHMLKSHNKSSPKHSSSPLQFQALLIITKVLISLIKIHMLRPWPCFPYITNSFVLQLFTEHLLRAKH